MRKGLRYDEGKERVDLIPADVLLALGRHYGVGSQKYFDDNWRNGLSYKSTYGCLMRHLLQWWDGEDLDEETGSHHLIAVIWNAVALMYYELHPHRYNGFDDRWYAHNTHHPGTDEVEENDDMVDALSYSLSGGMEDPANGPLLNISPERMSKMPSELLKIRPQTAKWDGKTERRTAKYAVTITDEEMSKIQQRLTEATGTSVRITDIINNVKALSKKGEEKNNERE